MGQGHFLRHKFFFIFFFVLVCFQDKVKQLSSWKVFDWNRFGIRFDKPNTKIPTGLFLVPIEDFTLQLLCDL